jgi:lysophospholipase L1-like esterase
MLERASYRDLQTIAIGCDSMGQYPTFAEGWPALLKTALGIGTMVNASIPGQKVKAIKDRWRVDVLDTGCAVAGLHVGTNDAAGPTPLNEFEDDLGSLVLITRERGVPLTIVTPPPRYDGQGNVTPYAQLMRDVAAASPIGSIVVADIHAFFNTLTPAQIATCILPGDGVHYSAYGAQVVCNFIVSTPGAFRPII